MVSQLIEYIHSHADSWPIKIRREDELTYLLRFNKEACGIVESEEIGTIIFWFVAQRQKPCLVTKIVTSSLSIDYIKTCAERQQRINKKIGIPIFPVIYDIARICSQTVIFQEVINAPTYEMELSQAIYGPSGNISKLKQIVKRHFKEIGFLYKRLKTLYVAKDSRRWGDWAYRIGKDYKDNYGLKLDFLTDNCLAKMKERINSMPLQKNYVLVDHHSANYFRGPRIVDQIDKTLERRMKAEPGILDAFLFIIAYLRASPINAVYQDWLGVIACSIQDNHNLSEIPSCIRQLLQGAGLSLDEPQKVWALMMASFFLRARDELTFHKNNIFVISRLRNDFEKLTKRLVEIQDLIENDKDCDCSFVRQCEENFNPPSKLIPIKSLEVRPHLIEEGYKGFNIIQHKERFYAMAMDLGPIDFFKITESEIKEYQNRSKCFLGKSIDEVKQVVDGSINENLQTDTVDVHKNTDTLQAALSGKDKTIKALQKESEAHTIEIAELKNGLEKLISEQLSLKTELQNIISDHTTSLQLLQKEYQAHIDEVNNLKDTLKKVEADHKDAINLLQKESKSHSQDVTNLKAELATIKIEKEQIGLLNKEVSRKDEDITKLTADINELNKKIDSLQAEVSEKDKNIAVLNKEISHRDEGIAQLNKDAEVLNNKIDVLKTTHSDKDRTIEALKKEILHKDENIVKLTKNIDGLNKRIDAIQMTFLDKDKSIEAFKKEISYKDENLAKLSKDIGILNNKIEALQTAMSEKGNNIKGLESELINSQEKYKMLAEDMKAQAEYFQNLKKR